MFCRFGSLDDSRPVAATAWLNEVCSRPVAGFDQRRQRVDVGALELGQRRGTRRSSPAPGAAPASSSSVSASVDGAGLGPPDHRQRQLAEQHVGQLLVRVDVEGAAGQRVNLGLEADQRLRRPRARARAGSRRPADAAALDARQHARQRQLQSCDTGGRGRPRPAFALLLGQRQRRGRLGGQPARRPPRRRCRCRGGRCARSPSRPRARAASRRPSAAATTSRS